MCAFEIFSSLMMQIENMPLHENYTQNFMVITKMIEIVYVKFIAFRTKIITGSLNFNCSTKM